MQNEVSARCKVSIYNLFPALLFRRSRPSCTGGVPTQAEHSADKPADDTVLSIERRLHWLLIENPTSASEPELGYCVRDESGLMRGLNLWFPSAFLRGGQSLRGLCSGTFFVEPPARSLGFYLFKKYLAYSGLFFLLCVHL